MAEAVIRASRPGNRRRRPKQYHEGRVCAAQRCSTIVSRYNRSEFCFEHRPVTFPRLRGVLTESSS